MGILRKVLVTIVVLAVLLGVIGFFLPSAAHVERNVKIDAPISTVYTTLADFRQFNEWSPWAKLDPDTKYEYEGMPGTVGSLYRWSSDHREVGNGSQKIIEMVPGQLIKIELVFGGEDEPAIAYYKLAPADDGTEVVWGFDADFGGNPYMHYFPLMMDRILGPTYEEGLANLKKRLESSGS